MDTIQSMPKNKKHIQHINIIPTQLLGYHWVCSYYDTKHIFIYDSLNTKILSECKKQFLEKLFPTTMTFFIKYPVQFPIVQKQPNSNDCGVFAMPFAISLLFNIKPDVQCKT